MLLLLFACLSTPKESTPVADSQGSTTDSQTTDSQTTDSQTTDPTLPQDLVGKPPENPVPLPEFVAYNSDESPRSREDLLGHPTIVWFYPAASTAG